MHRDTPHRTHTPTRKEHQRRIHDAVCAVDLRWLAFPHQLAPGAAREHALGFLIATVAAAAGPGAARHMSRVGRIAREVALLAGWSPEAAADLLVHGALHDLGKAAVCAAVLGKPGRLSASEMREVRSHARRGWAMLRPARTPLLRAAARVALEHHERWDGRGYPRGIAGERIGEAARLVAIADVYDALTSQRPYRGPLAPTVALEIMRGERGGHFDPTLFDHFLHAWEESQGF